MIKHDHGKLRYDLVPWEAMDLVVAGLTHGAKKYGDENWKTVAPERYLGAIGRHYSAHMQGKVMDDDGVNPSYLPHMALVCCNALFVLGLMLLKPQKKTEAQVWRESLNDDQINQLDD